ncbi:hypothetical protein FACS189426_17200 [Bacteroidia bacterium]|nr:hypothetical protein FACS189426_17200 [Bacteroidia bacterium]
MKIMIIILVAIIGLICLGYLGVKYYIKRRIVGFERFYGNMQENTIRESNKLINNLFIEFSENPTEELRSKIFAILDKNQTYVILTFIDNKDPNDNRTYELTNSINFRKIKNGEIVAFTDFDIMRKYVGKNYISTEIILIGNFFELCKQYNVKTIILNHILKNPFILTANDE